MKTIARFRNPEDAHLFRAYLATNEVDAHVLDEHLVQLFWHYSDAIGGVRVVVADEEFNAAIELRDEHSKALKSDPPAESTPRAWPLVLVLSFFVGIPCLFFGRKKLNPSKESVG